MPIIQLLNKKGYNTLYCCSGHVTRGFNAQLYIKFAQDYNFQNLPQGKTMENDNCIRYNFPKGMRNRNGRKLQLIEELYQWAKELKRID